MEVDFKMLGRQIKAARLKLNMTQTQLAEKMGLSRNHISHIETGAGKLSFELYVKLCWILPVSPIYLLEGNLDVDEANRRTDKERFDYECYQAAMEAVADYNRTYGENHEEKQMLIFFEKDSP